MCFGKKSFSPGVAHLGELRVCFVDGVRGGIDSVGEFLLEELVVFGSLADPGDEILCGPSAHLDERGLLLCGQIHRVLRIQMRPQRRLVVFQFILPRLQRVFKRLY